MIFFIRDCVYWLFSWIRIKPLYYLCRVYVHAYDGENCPNSGINGEYKYLKKQAHKNLLCFDVGGNIGDYTEKLLEFNKDTIVHTFEPDPKNWKILNEKQFFGKVVLNQLALGETQGRLRLYQGDVFSSFHHSSFNDNGVVDVEVDTLDNYCRINNITRIDLLKIDVEGHELSVLKGASNLLSNYCVRNIQFEFGSPALAARVYFKDIYDYLCSFENCQIYKVTNRGLIFIEKYEESLEHIGLANFIAKFEKSR